jgi:hypothetical protein
MYLWAQCPRKIPCAFTIIHANLLITAALHAEGIHDGWQSMEKKARNQQKSGLAIRCTALRDFYCLLAGTGYEL